MRRIQLKSAWKEYIEGLNPGKASAGVYNYPVTDKKTDKNLSEQAPGTRGKEQDLYIKWLEKPWQVALDFGCGTGANFHCFDQPQNKGGLLIGLEPDRGRAELARNHGARLKFIETAIVSDGVSFLENSPHDLFLDKILCSQVLGHVSGPDLNRIMNAFGERLRPGGQCGLAVPVVGASYATIAGDSAFKPGEDYLHLVNFEVSHEDPAYRKQVAPDQFDDLARRPPRNNLPVRCFWLPQFPLADNSHLPVRAEQPPTTLVEIVRDSFHIDGIWIYSIHEQDHEGRPVAIGDAFIVMTRR